VGALHKGTHEGCPYETRKMFAEKKGNYDLVLRSCWLRLLAPLGTEATENWAASSLDFLCDLRESLCALCVKHVSS